MPEVRNCLTCKWEPDFHKVSSPGSKYGWEEVGHCKWMIGEEWPDSFRSLAIKKEHEGLRYTFTCEDEEGIDYITSCPAHTPKEQE